MRGGEQYGISLRILAFSRQPPTLPFPADEERGPPSEPELTHLCPQAKESSSLSLEESAQEVMARAAINVH